jgi:predicted amidohydrolase
MILAHNATKCGAYSGDPGKQSDDNFKSIQDARIFAKRRSIPNQIWYVSDNRWDDPEFIYYAGRELYCVKNGVITDLVKGDLYHGKES